MKSSVWIVLPFLAIIAYNGFLAKRDINSINEAHKRVCATLPQPHPDCDSVKPITSQAANKNRSLDYD